MWGQADLQKLVQMLDYLGFNPAVYPAYSVVLGQGASVAPGVAGTILASTGPSSNPAFETLSTLGIQPALGYTPAHSGANSDITSLGGLTGALQTPSSITAGLPITSSGGASGAQFVLEGNAGTFRNIQWQTGGTDRWILTCDSTAESGSNAGSNLDLISYSDSGSNLGAVLSFTRATGQAAFSGPVTIAGEVGVQNTSPAGYAMVIGANLGIGVSNGMLGVQAPNPGSTDVANVVFQRSVNYSGGSAGFVNSAVKVYGSVGSGVTDYEWPLVTVLDNSATGGQNSAFYAQGNRVTTGAGPTWAATIEAREEVAIANPTTGLIGLEVDNRSNGTDGNSQRVGIDVVCARYNSSGPATSTSYGVRVQNNGDSSSGINVAFQVQASNVFVGLDTSASTIGGAAVRMASGQPIAFDVNSTNLFRYDGTGLNYQASAATKVRLNQDGSVLMNGAHAVQMIPTVSTGSVSPSLTGNKPGSSSSIGTWLSIVIDGSQYWIPAWNN